ncbi:RDD family protein [Dyadobacter frigoris]|uniref:RDD family protein n=1 Tax=Dyadobacter frigoris TaxID=2576211 RepID=A0A4U6D5L5_9BACT|nr:RDD family protein [Dyadobacter frigoris]TKT91996.1 RDD family protein [Dyadobacter frigoris]GLU53128.1 hypothetical protein Dfri01_25890 [Dyadobacter frigoris]
MQNPSTVSAGSRLASMLLDHFIMSMIAVSFSIPAMISTFSNAFETSHDQQDIDVFGGNFFFFSLIGFALYFCKDAIDARSPGKRILKTQVVNNSDGLPASPVKCMVRNIFCVLWPIELVVTIISPSRRIGDFVAGTKVVPFENESAYKPDYSKLGLSVILAYGIMIAVSYPFIVLNESFKPKTIQYVKESFNQAESTNLDKVISDSLHIKSDSKVYDKIEGEDLKFISVIVNLDDNLLSNDSDYNNLKSKFIPVLANVHPDSTFVGRIQFVYKTENSMQTRVENYDWRSEK